VSGPPPSKYIQDDFRFGSRGFHTPAQYYSLTGRSGRWRRSNERMPHPPATHRRQRPFPARHSSDYSFLLPFPTGGGSPAPPVFLCCSSILVEEARWMQRWWHETCEEYRQVSERGSTAACTSPRGGAPSLEPSFPLPSGGPHPPLFLVWRTRLRARRSAARRGGNAPYSLLCAARTASVAKTSINRLKPRIGTMQPLPHG
jgi:hypothetical protein